MESKSGLHAKENCCAVAIYTVHACESVSLSYSAVGYSFYSVGDIFRDSFFRLEIAFLTLGMRRVICPNSLYCAFFRTKWK